MPARIVVVHDDPEFIDGTMAALVAAGHDVRAFTDTMSALKALERAQRVEVLVTPVVFPAGQPNGVSLALIAKLKRPGVKVLFAAEHETREHTEGLGDFLPAPADPVEIARAGREDAQLDRSGQPFGSRFPGPPSRGRRLHFSADIAEPVGQREQPCDPIGSSRNTSGVMN